MNAPYQQPSLSALRDVPDVSEDVHSVFRRAFLAVTPGATLDVAPLRRHVRSFVRTAKERGDPPERVIVALRKITIGSVHWHQLSAEQRALRDAVFRLCLDEYFGPLTSSESG